MVSELVARCREFRKQPIGLHGKFFDEAYALIDEAADRIEALETALKPFATFIGNDTRMPDTMPLTVGSAIAKPQVTVADFRRARDALDGK